MKRNIQIWGTTAVVLIVLLLLTLFMVNYKTQEAIIRQPLRLGVLILDDFRKTAIEGLQEGLRSYGVNNLRIRVKNADGDPKKLDDLARELAAEDNDYIIPVGGLEADAVAKAAPRTTVVFVDVDHPRERGINFSGVKNTYSEHIGERMELVKKFLPGVQKFTFLTTRQIIAGVVSIEKARDFAAKNPGIALDIIEVNTADDVVKFTGTLSKERGVIFISNFAPIQVRFGELIKKALEQGVVVVGFNRQQTQDGSLLSFGESRYSLGWRAARIIYDIHVKRIPADSIGVREAAPELTINKKTARALGIEIPPSLSQEATLIIEQ